MMAKIILYIGTMYAVGWYSAAGERFPEPIEYGAWVIAANRNIAKLRRVSPKQKIRKVKITMREV